MTEPATVKLNEEKIKRWLQNGAQVSPLVRSLIKKNIPGVIEGREDHQAKKIQAARKARKERAKGGAKTAKAKKK